MMPNMSSCCDRKALAFFHNHRAMLPEADEHLHEAGCLSLLHLCVSNGIAQSCGPGLVLDPGGAAVTSRTISLICSNTEE